jgi:hypothetical protein
MVLFFCIYLIFYWSDWLFNFLNSLINRYGGSSSNLSWVACERHKVTTFLTNFIHRKKNTKGLDKNANYTYPMLPRWSRGSRCRPLRRHDWRLRDGGDDILDDAAWHWLELHSIVDVLDAPLWSGRAPPLVPHGIASASSHCPSSTHGLATSLVVPYGDGSFPWWPC